MAKCREEHRVAFALLHLCKSVQETLPARSRAGEDLLFHCAQISVLIASAGAELTPVVRSRRLRDARDHLLEVAQLLLTLRRRGRGSRAHVTAAIEIADRLTEQLTHRLERRR